MLIDLPLSDVSNLETGVLLFFSVSEVAFGVLDALFARGIIFGSA